MKNQKLATRYASSLITLASEHGVLQEVYQDMQLLDAVINQNREFDVFLKSPVIKIHLKTQVIRKLLIGKVNNLTERFVELLIKNSREIYLHDVVESFMLLYDLKKNIKTAFITTAKPLNEENLAKLKIITSHIKADHVKVVQKVDESLIGGFKLNVDDYQIDASIASKLSELKRDFGKNAYLSEL
jgi:F-type H+-transporting ATPase subunit delta